MSHHAGLIAGILLVSVVVSAGWAVNVISTSGPFTAPGDWPKELAQVSNSVAPVGRVCSGDGEQMLFYKGGTSALNSFLANYGKISEVPHLLVIHTGAKQNYAPQKIGAFDWMLAAGGHDAASLQVEKDVRVVVRVDAWIDGDIVLDEIKVPDNMTAKSGGEVEQFISDHEKKRAQGK